MTNAIYALPETPSAEDIIKRSIVAHPSLFRKALISQAEQHDDYAKLSTNPRAVQGAKASFNACLRAYDAVGLEDVSAIMADCGTMVIALNVACKLQCIPTHVRTRAAVDWQEQHGN